MKAEKSCGAVIFRKNQGILEFLLVHQQQGDHWFFSKGHVEEGESEEQTALREINEEVGLHVHIIPGFREMYSYVIVAADISKTVVFFLGEFVSGDVIISDELHDAVWFSYDQALQKLTYDNAKSTLMKAYAFLVSQ